MPSVSTRKHSVSGLLRLVRQYGAATPVDAAHSSELLARIRTYADGLDRDAQAARNETLTLQEVWDAAGGNPGIRPTKQEVLDALRMLDQACDEVEAAQSPERLATPVRFGCHCDLEPGMQPDGCVLDYGRPEDCVHSNSGKVKQREKCEHWRPLTITPLVAPAGPTAAHHTTR